MTVPTIDVPAAPAAGTAVDPAVAGAPEFDLDLLFEPAGQRPDIMRIFASNTEAPCSCSSTHCH